MANWAGEGWDWSERITIKIMITIKICRFQSKAPEKTGAVQKLRRFGGFRHIWAATRNRMQAVRHIMVRRGKQLWNSVMVITKRRPMKRLPGYDSRTSRAELAAFCSLGLVGTALVTAAVSNALKFAAARDDIVAKLTVPGSTDQALASVNATNGLTN